MNVLQKAIVAEHRAARCVPKGTRSCDCTNRVIEAGWPATTSRPKTSRDLWSRAEWQKSEDEKAAYIEDDARYANE